MRTPAERAVGLLADPPDEPDLSAGYLDLLGPATEPPPSLAQSAMRSTFLPQIYEKVWRPAGFNLAKGWPIGPDTAEEHAMARDWLGLGQPGESVRPALNVLDVACGPGNVTRALAAGVGADGLVVGLDASATMLSRAVSRSPGPRPLAGAESLRDLPGGARLRRRPTAQPHARAVAEAASQQPRAAEDGGAPVCYVRGNAVDLPFRDAAFDAVCCFGALYLFDDPWRAVDGMTRVLKPGGRLIILTSRRPFPVPAGPIGREVRRRAAGFTGLTVFGDGQVTGALAERGFTGVRRRRYPLMQLVAGQRA